MDFRWTHAIAMWQAPPLSAQRPAARGWPSTAGARCSCNPGFHPIPLSARDMRLRQVLRHLTPCCQGPAAMCCAGHGRHLLRACMQVVLTFSMQGVGNFVNVAVGLAPGVPALASCTVPQHGEPDSGLGPAAGAADPDGLL